MGSSKPQPVKAPFEQKQQQTQQETREQTNRFGLYSPADTPEGQRFLSAPLDYGDPTNVDPGVGRRTAGYEQDAELRNNSALNFGVPRFIRQANQAKELRDIRGQGAYEAQQAEFMNQQGNNQRRGMITEANLARLQATLPQILQLGSSSTGTGSSSGSSSGFNTQVTQPQPGFWQRLALGVAQGAAGGLTGGLVG